MLPDEQVDQILKNTPEYLLGLIGELMRALLYRMNLEEEKAESAVAKIKERKMGRLFEGVTFDFQAARKELEEAAAKAKEEAEIAKKETEAAKQEREAAKQETEAAKQEKEAAKRERETAKQETEIARHVAKMLIKGSSEDEVKESLRQRFALSREQAEVEYRKVTG